MSISIEESSVGNNSVSVVVRVTPPSLRVDEHLAALVLALHPTLAQHVCKHRGFGRFGDKLIGTTLPHLVEHIAIDLLVEEAQASHPSAGSPRPRAGNTTWLDREQGLMRIRLSCDRASGTEGTAQVGQGDGATVPLALSPAVTDAEVTRTAISRAVTLMNSLLER